MAGKDKTTMKLERYWYMPSSNTFTIAPFKNEILTTIKDGMVVVDPFSNSSKYGTITNDLNPDFDTTYHMDALEFLKMLPDQSADVVLYDPPYSVRQASECYRSFGKENITATVTNAKYWAQCKDNVARILKDGGIVLSFGWNSNGIGKNRSMILDKVVIVAHGGHHNDTIMTVEHKHISQLTLF